MPITTTIFGQDTRHAEPRPEMRPEISAEFYAALAAAGVTADAEIEPDGQITIETNCTQICVGAEDGWITATARYADDTEAMIYEGESLTDLAAAIARTLR